MWIGSHEIVNTYFLWQKEMFENVFCCSCEMKFWNEIYSEKKDNEKKKLRLFIISRQVCKIRSLYFLFILFIYLFFYFFIFFFLFFVFFLYIYFFFKFCLVIMSLHVPIFFSGLLSVPLNKTMCHCHCVVLLIGNSYFIAWRTEIDH